jgi:NADH/NAD ratio-sensing transcriptional regulator Rex
MAARGARMFDTTTSYDASEQVAGSTVNELGIANVRFWATNVKVASVTFSRVCVRKRRAHASMWIFMDVRPTDSTCV